MKLSASDKATRTKKLNRIEQQRQDVVWPTEPRGPYHALINDIRLFIAQYSYLYRDSTTVEYYDEERTVSVATNVEIELPEGLPCRLAHANVITIVPVDSAMDDKLIDHCERIMKMKHWGFSNRKKRDQD